ncbi:hypothetical protein C8J57DRAFT_1240561 [Mycena rebaudengoi]|nr:hypothetical protein C8J57DRAFT_1240561 [Mycena rebaudengoi]
MWSVCCVSQLAQLPIWESYQIHPGLVVLAKSEVGEFPELAKPIELSLAPYKAARMLAGNRGGIGCARNAALGSGGVPAQDTQVDVGRASAQACAISAAAAPSLRGQAPPTVPPCTTPTPLWTPPLRSQPRDREGKGKEPAWDIDGETCLSPSSSLWLLILATHANIVLRIRGQFFIRGWHAGTAPSGTWGYVLCATVRAVLSTVTAKSKTAHLRQRPRVVIKKAYEQNHWG